MLELARRRRHRARSPTRDTEQNPTTTNLAEIVELYRDERCDGLVGLGGGSSMDAAKAASALIENGGSIWDYRGKDLVPRPGRPSSACRRPAAPAPR